MKEEKNVSARMDSQRKPTACRTAPTSKPIRPLVHAPLPWRLDEVGAIRDANGNFLQHRDGVAIVPVMNAHVDLLDLVRTIVTICDSGDEHMAQLACMENSPLVGKAREVIARFGYGAHGLPNPKAERVR